MLNLLWQLVLKDLRVFASDRRAMIISFAVPVLIASFMAMLTSNMSSGGKAPSKIPIVVVDQDQSEISKAVLKRLDESEAVLPHNATLEQARQEVDGGKAPIAFVLPKGFGEQTVAAMKGGSLGELQTITDPTKRLEGQVANGAFMQASTRTIAEKAFGVDTIGGGDGATSSAFRLPFERHELTKGDAPKEETDRWSGTAHAFAGMAMQGLLFWAIESAMTILRERKQGIWRRLRAAPVSPAMLLLSRAVSGALRALAILCVVFGSGMLIFHMRVAGSVAGFALIAVAASIMAATFGLFVAALGRTEQQSRGLSILAVLGMLMLGGAWFPSFLMPGWVQTAGSFIPVKWAVDGFDAMTWRAQGLGQALTYAAVLLGFAAVFGAVALRRIRWEYEV